MSIFDNQTSIINQRRAINSYVAITEPVKITNGWGSLRENPNLAAGVVITNGATTYSICNFNQGQQPAIGIISIDYDQAIIYGLSDVEGLTLTASYQGMGAIFLNSSRIATKISGNTVTQTLADTLVAETTRVTNENTRLTNETTRQSNETSRMGRDTAFQLIEAYNATHAYVPLNKVTYNGSTYQNILATTNNIPTNTTFWILVAAAGANGSGTVATITSTDASIAVAGTAANPDLSVQTGITANKIAKRDVNGNIPNNGFQLSSISVSTTLTPSQSGVILTTTAGSTITLTLPTAVGNAQLSYIIKKNDSGSGTISLATTSSQLIDGVTTRTLSGQYSYVQVVSDGTGWQIVDGSNASTLGGNTPSVTSAPNAIVQRNGNSDIPDVLKTQDIFNDYVITGLLPPTSANLTSITTTGSAYIIGQRVNKSATSNTYSANSDTYIDLDMNGNYTYITLANGVAIPAITTNSIRLFKVITNGTAVTTVADLRAVIPTASITAFQEMFPNLTSVNFNGMTIGSFVLSRSLVTLGTITLA